MAVTKLSDFAIESDGHTINSINTDRILCVVGEDEIRHIVPNDWSTTVLISIQDPDTNPISQDIRDLYLETLTVQFWDVTQGQYESMVNESKTSNRRVFDPISKQQGAEIREFILKHKEHTFAIHCAAGISRSAGAAQAVECLLDCGGNVYHFQTAFKDPIKEHWRYCPNHTVFERIVFG